MTSLTSTKSTMSSKNLRHSLALWAFSLMLAPVVAGAQQPGSSAVVSMTLPGVDKPVQGWSVKRGLLGRAVYASIKGKPIGMVMDLVVTPGPSPYVLIIGVGGFVELGGHMVAIPLDQVDEQGGVLLMPGATRETLKAMPRLVYTKTAVNRAKFIQAASVQLTDARLQLRVLQKLAAAETGEANKALARDYAAFETQITVAEDKLADLEKAEIGRWTLLQSDVQAALNRVEANTAPAPAPAHAPLPMPAGEKPPMTAPEHR